MTIRRGCVHFGRGSDEAVAKVEITWPSGTVQVIEDVEADQFLVVTEPEA